MDPTITAFIGLGLSVATFFFGRHIQARSEGRDSGKQETRLDTLERDLARVERGLETKACAEDLARVEKQLEDRIRVVDQMAKDIVGMQADIRHILAILTESKGK